MTHLSNIELDVNAWQMIYRIVHNFFGMEDVSVERELEALVTHEVGHFNFYQKANFSVKISFKLYCKIVEIIKDILQKRDADFEIVTGYSFEEVAVKFGLKADKSS